MDNNILIHIDSFDGPFDLLYYLIQKNKLDIFDMPVTSITEQYLEYLFGSENLNMEVASEFLVMASTLLHIKSRMLLPKHDESDETDDEIDSKEELILRLIEYKKYRDITPKLREMAQVAQMKFYKYPESLHFKRSVQLGTHNCFELWNLYENLVETINVNVLNTKEKMKMIKTRERVSVGEKMHEIMTSLLTKTKIIFNDVFKKETKTKLEIVAGFVAMLELSRLNKVVISQRSLFDRIFINRKGKKSNES